MIFLILSSREKFFWISDSQYGRNCSQLIGGYPRWLSQKLANCQQVRLLPSRNGWIYPITYTIHSMISSGWLRCLIKISFMSSGTLYAGANSVFPQMSGRVRNIPAAKAISVSPKSSLWSCWRDDNVGENWYISMIYGFQFCIEFM